MEAAVRKWTIPGPDASVLAKADVAALLRISDKTLDRMIAAGRFPCGIKVSPGSEPIWFGQDIAAWMHLASRMIVSDDEKMEKS